MFAFFGALCLHSKLSRGARGETTSTASPRTGTLSIITDTTCGLKSMLLLMMICKSIEILTKCADVHLPQLHAKYPCKKPILEIHIKNPYYAGI